MLLLMVKLFVSLSLTMAARCGFLADRKYGRACYRHDVMSVCDRG